MHRSLWIALSVIALIATACGSPVDEVADQPDADDATEQTNPTEGSASGGESTPTETTPTEPSAPAATSAPADFGEPPAHPAGPWSAETSKSLDNAVMALLDGNDPSAALAELAESGDPRLAWALADLRRFSPPGPTSQALQAATTKLLGVDLSESASPWNNVVSHLIAWDTPVPEEYFVFKRSFYSQLEPAWGELFTDDNTVDWRHVSWGGVGIDDRPSGSSAECRCIPALDDPAVTDADGGSWYPDDRIVFGVVIDGEARAYPKNIMEVHEMVNDTLGGRRIGMPYCTLCGSAQAYFTDELGDAYPQPVFRTSGLLIRSNKMMYELETRSLIDTFTGEATSGPMGEAGIAFAQVSVITTTWADWKTAHPETTIVAEDGGIGRSYVLDPLGGRDDNGPIFPIGSVDPRLPVQEPVLGVIGESGDAIAIPVDIARTMLADDKTILVDGVAVELDGGGLRAMRRDGSDAGAHQAFWFAWSQFRPETKLWPEDFS